MTTSKNNQIAAGQRVGNFINLLIASGGSIAIIYMLAYWAKHAHVFGL